jgi:hypothetical protein
VQHARGLAIATLLLVGCATADRRFVRDAQIQQVGAGGASQIGAGSRVVLKLREWDPGEVFTTDDESYRKVTIELSPVVVGERVPVGDPRMKVVLSDGSSVWDVSRCGSETGEGSVLVERYAGDSLTAQLALSMDCRYRYPKIPAEIVRVEGTFRFREISFAELSPWLDGGIDGPALYQR